jgi:lipid-A-disaccharide synthase
MLRRTGVLPHDPLFLHLNPKTFMLIAGEASGDQLAAELVCALRSQWPEAKFIGAGGPKMVAAGTHLAFDLTQHSALGLSWMKDISEFRRLFNQLLALAIKQKPDAVIGVDYGGFNLRFGHAVKKLARKHRREWNPKIIQFVSPQVWASRPGRAKRLAKDYDLLLSIFPFEKDWYAQRVPKLRVEFVGHPVVERYTNAESGIPPSSLLPPLARQGEGKTAPASPMLLLLPGSRESELQRHLTVMLGALKLIQAKLPDLQPKMVLPNASLARLANSLDIPDALKIQTGNLPRALAQADVAIASTGTVTMECAFFGVPTVTLYKTAWLTFQIAKRIVTVKSLTMPNLLAHEEIFPEFVQDAATPENIAGAALDLLQNEPRRAHIKTRLAEVIATLGGPGAPKRAAAAISSLFEA